MESNPEKERAGLPSCAVEYIDQVVRQIRYRKRVRAEVREELQAHFEDDLRDCANAEQREARARELIEQFGDARLLAVLCRRGKKRCRPLWRKILIRTAQGMGLVILYWMVCSAPLFLGRPNIRVNYVNWLNDRWRPGQGEIQNAKEYYDEAARQYVKPPDGLEGKRSNWNASAAGHSVGKWFSDYNDVEMGLLEQWLVDNRPAFEMLRRGSWTTRCWPTYRVEVADLGDPNFLIEAMVELAGYRKVVQALRESIAHQAYRGEWDQALDDCLVAWRFGRHMQGKGLLNEQLVGIAIEGLAVQSLPLILDRCQVPASTLERIQTSMAAMVDPRRPGINLDGEEVFWRDRIQRTFTDDGQGGGHALRNGIPYAAGDWTGNLLGILVFDYPDRRDAEAMVEQYFERMECELLMTPYENGSRGRRETPALRAAPNTLIALVEPAHERLGQLLWRMKTGELATLTIVAVLRYEADHGGYPETLDQLVTTDYLDTLPDDPFGNGPLSYRRTDDEFLLYSWGRNLQDDGGKLGTGGDGKPRMWAGNGDWVFWPMRELEAKP